MKLPSLLFLLITPVALRAQITEQPDPLRPSLPDTTRAVTDSTGRQAAQIKPADTPVFRYRITADGTLSSGNVNRTLLQLTSALDYEISRLIKVSTTPSFTYGRQNGLLAEREWFGDARGTLCYENRLYYLAFGSYERSNLRKIRNRYTAAAGFGYKLLNRKRAYISLTNVIMQERTDFIEQETINTWRNSTRLFGEYAFGGDRWTITHTAFYQPAFGPPVSRNEQPPRRNVRWNGTVSVTLRFSATLSLRTTLANSYESIIAPGRLNNDLRWTVGLVYGTK